MEAIVEVQVDSVNTGIDRFNDQCFKYTFSSAPWTTFKGDFEAKRKDGEELESAPAFEAIRTGRPVRVKIERGRKKTKSSYENLHGYYVNVKEVDVPEACSPSNWRNFEDLSTFMLADLNGNGEGVESLQNYGGSSQSNGSPDGIARKAPLYPPSINELPPLDTTDEILEEVFDEPIPVIQPFTNKPDLTIWDRSGVNPLGLNERKISVRQSAIDKAIKAAEIFMLADSSKEWTPQDLANAVDYFTNKFADAIWGTYQREKPSNRVED